MLIKYKKSIITVLLLTFFIGISSSCKKKETRLSETNASQQNSNCLVNRQKIMKILDELERIGKTWSSYSLDEAKSKVASLVESISEKHDIVTLARMSRALEQQWGYVECKDFHAPYTLVFWHCVTILAKDTSANKAQLETLKTTSNLDGLERETFERIVNSEMPK